MIDFASNDYLGLAHSKKNAKKAFDRLLKESQFGAKASQLVNGYHEIHAQFEEKLLRTFGFESAIIFGSGYLANLALTSVLPRRGDVILMDEEYHASGKVGAKLSNATTYFFAHNDADDLIAKLKQFGRNSFVFVEGVYSMIGDVLNPDIIKAADEYGAYLIIDEAHSLGTIGDNLLGIYSKFNITPKPTHIKMGTFSKALGSYGAYIVCSDVTARYLQNRANSLIYTTAPSLFDVAFAMYNFESILKSYKTYSKQLKELRQIYQDAIGIKLDSQIAMFNNNAHEAYKNLYCNGFITGLIRPPTIQVPSLRITLRIADNNSDFKRLCDILREFI